MSWPENDNTPGGAYVTARFDELGNGTCTINFGRAVYWFHSLLADIVPNGAGDPASGIYKVCTPNQAWQNSGNFSFVVNFNKDAANQVDVNDITWSCDPNELYPYAVGSFPQNMDHSSASSKIYIGSQDLEYMTLTFPYPVLNFTCHNAESMGSADNMMFMLTNITDTAMEVDFNFRYETMWFAAAEMGISAEKKTAV
eukprot:TRINITY_DN22733_c0_g1_i1.p1 TRINITY_DN22733_c0_g1~~TRINITY_DN22733_c0_g1_i1.p1  ORF type:complete len:231 (+),score=-7.60 TRINITY_DN22733_c0_g1_i1:100-693(+)